MGPSQAICRSREHPTSLEIINEDFLELRKLGAHGMDRRTGRSVTNTFPCMLGRIMNWLTVALPAVMILLVVSVGSSSACSSHNGAASRPTASAAAPSISVTAPVTQSLIGSVGPAKYINHKFCCGRGLGSSHSLNCAGICCSACGAGIITASNVGPPDFIFLFEIPRAQAGLSSAYFSAAFRPPRLSLDQAPA